ncbi:SRPBCC domain-containing protein [Dyadobacter chenwenxiniae]|uniref:SRPBCC domain-containing protein n=1 Tax=Dyadobacter chenwenxiniae TaxID=2906456 RepID=A0A9X1PKZ0_9BACT|nr:SRPBCC domain-containing protein [Dyadobacter chenwenxiniae]MCF0063015.1 SRPBCC domain-containing protein [Dyadobacter chenwenxiniae]UON84812.1 SRPBCC domain-containing protein [Dyadobacter chenwenxiniae]
METQSTIICPPELTSRPLGLKVEKLIALPVSKVFKAWTSQIDLWFASPGSFLGKAENNTPFYFETSYQGVRHPHYGRFLTVRENEKIELTWVTGEGGTEGAETVLTVNLSGVDNGTFLSLTHAGFASESSRNNHQEAWPVVLAQLEERMSRPAD